MATDTHQTDNLSDLADFALKPLDDKDRELAAERASNERLAQYVDQLKDRIAQLENELRDSRRYESGLWQLNDMRSAIVGEIENACTLASDGVHDLVKLPKGRVSVEVDAGPELEVEGTVDGMPWEGTAQIVCVEIRVW